MSSILINGSPTREFNINRGLRQGDPLSHFLFILATEGLHVAVEDAMVAGLYRGLKVNTLTLSHLVFADDALFIYEWSPANIKSMVSILECFHRVSGLKINFHKSNLFGVGVPFEEVNHFASTLVATLGKLLSHIWDYLFTVIWLKLRVVILSLKSFLTAYLNGNLRFFPLEDQYIWPDNMRISSSRKSILEAICGVFLWSLWNILYEMIFGISAPRRSTLFDKIVNFSYRWYSSRKRLSSISWNNWLQNPLVVSTL
nr:RNA-directed DNA polymerase, eukaryota, reverse transcriptase zinc-binding domain protein [Tanacetum cinerariifolium]